MNKEKIVLDFAVFVLMEIEELCSYINNFFGQTYKHDPFSDKKILEYEDFVKQDIITSQIILNQEFNSEIKSLNDLLNKEEITNLLNYLNEEFTEGFPDGDGFGSPSNLDFKTDDLHLLFDKYLELRKFNQNVFITYFIQLINKLQYEESIKNVDLEIKNILNNEKSKKSLNLNLEIEYIESKKNEYRQKLIENNQFQLKGFISEKEINIDFDESLISSLEFFNNENISNIKYSAYFKIEYSFDYLIYQFLELRQVGNTKGIKNIINNEKREDDADPLWLSLGILFAEGKIQELIKNNPSLSFKKIALHFENKSYDTYLKATINNYTRSNKDKNIYIDIVKMEKIISHCKSNKIKICDAFMDKYNLLKNGT